MKTEIKTQTAHVQILAQNVENFQKVLKIVSKGRKQLVTVAPRR